MFQLGQAPDEMIESRAEVVAELTQHDSPIPHGGLFERLGIDGELIRMMRVQLCLDGIRVIFDPRIDEVMELRSAVVCPLEFRPMTP